VTDEEILRQAERWSAEGLGVAIATVIATWGSAPRPAGSQLAVNGRGELAGSVSGGCVEGAVVEEALGVIRDGRPRLLTYGVTEERAWEVGLACGGRIQLHLERLG
jgi:xanthine dehydrogenase accessory factor